jgi:diadenosine tetraphosphate (Ap4A) HIT family hydrolase
MGPEILCKRGCWQAEPGRGEFYSPGEVFIVAADYAKNAVPGFLGGGRIRDRAELAELIDLVSRKMVEALECERVYLVCLNEGDGTGLHFRLLPRYAEDQIFLDSFIPELGQTNDGLALMAEWRRQFILKENQDTRLSNDRKEDSAFRTLQSKHNDALERLRRALREDAVSPEE